MGIIIKKYLLLVFALSIVTTQAQSKREIADVYIKKANNNLGNLEIEDAKKNFDKAIVKLDTITRASVAQLGMLIYNETSEYKAAYSYGKQYFNLSKNRKSEDYQNMLILFVSIEEEIEKEELEAKKKEVEKIRKEKELKKLDSLQTDWKNKAASLALQVDSLYAFDKNGMALFKNKGKFGVINDLGKIIIEPKEYEFGIQFDGYIVLADDKEKPSIIEYYNTKEKKSTNAPSVSDFNTTSTHYGVITLPRANGRLVTYPNNSTSALVLDLKENKFVKINNQKKFLKNLKKTGKIEKYENDNKVRINDIWHFFGGHIGGGIHPLFQEDFSISGYFCSLEGKVLQFSDFNYLGAFYKDRVQVLNKEDISWINQSGVKIKGIKDEGGVYKGETSIQKTTAGYQFIKTIDAVKYLIKEDERLINLKDFLVKQIN